MVIHTDSLSLMYGKYTLLINSIAIFKEINYIYISIFDLLRQDLIILEFSFLVLTMRASVLVFLVYEYSYCYPKPKNVYHFFFINLMLRQELLILAIYISVLTMRASTRV